MKLTKLFVIITTISLSLGACTRKVYVYKHKPMPPGQAKKITGSKSAKPYAPGQQKKKK
jgi:hypothetical protein